MTRINVPTRAEERCPTCGTSHWLAVEYDEDGPYVDLDLDPCGADHCHNRLCSACPKWTCPMCLLEVCAHHRRIEMLDRGTPVTVCEACAADPGDLTRPQPDARMVTA
jgi:hypothetical protein